MHGTHQAPTFWTSGISYAGGSGGAALLRLPAPQREALAAMVLWEMSYEEAAAVLGSPVGTIKSRVSRARRKLRAALAGEEARGLCGSGPDTDPRARTSPFTARMALA